MAEDLSHADKEKNMNLHFFLKLIFTTLLFSMIGVSSAVANFEPDAKKGRRIYKQYCISCHGSIGQGDGDRMRNEQLDPRPRVHANGNYMNRIPDMRLFRVIKYGGKSINFSHIMPQWQHILSDKEIIDVIAHIRTLADPPFSLSTARFNCMLPPPKE